MNSIKLNYSILNEGCFYEIETTAYYNIVDDGSESEYYAEVDFFEIDKAICFEYQNQPYRVTDSSRLLKLCKLIENDVIKDVDTLVDVDESDVDIDSEVCENEEDN